jgi:hypothetical protein
VSLKPPPAVYDDGSVRSTVSLGSFPEPPGHFPIPRLTTSVSTNSVTNSLNVQQSPITPQGDGLMQPRTSSDASGSGPSPLVALSRVTESPLEESATPALTDGSLSSEHSQGQPTTPLATPTPDIKGEISAVAERAASNSDVPDGAKVAPSLPVSNPEFPSPASVSQSPLLSTSLSQQRLHVDQSPAINSRSSSSTGASSSFRRGDYLDDREFGVDSSAETAQSRAKTLGPAHRRIDGSDPSKGNGGIVAAIRDKYSRVVSFFFHFSKPSLNF